jgi:hypothetical protein
MLKDIVFRIRERHAEKFIPEIHVPKVPSVSVAKLKPTKRKLKIALVLFGFLFCAANPVAEMVYLAFLFGRYSKGKRYVGRIIVKMKSIPGRLVKRDAD